MRGLTHRMTHSNGTRTSNHPAPADIWLGVNYWSRAGGPRMWDRYDGAVVREELAVLAEHGCNMTRSFCYWPDFVPAPETLDELVLDRFSDFLDAHVEAGLGTIPTFIVGHMSGENWDPAWRQGRDLYRDVWLVSQQAWFAHEIARRFGAHPAIVGWLISNEMPLYGGSATSDEITAWARIQVQAVRAGGAKQPISLGDGAWGVEVTGNDNGYSLRELAPLVDFVGPHVYPMQDDEVRQLLTAAFVCELSGSFDKPVVLEEFGVSSDFASDENASDYYRQVLYTSLLAGARGWIAWNNCDYDDIRNQDPYRHHVFEIHFGMTDHEGKPKEQLRTFAAFSKFIQGVAAEGWEPVKGDAAIVVPEHLERVLPFTSPEYRQDIRDNLLQSYIAAREADLPVELVRERDGIPATARLYIAPCAKLLTAPGIDRLRELAHGGATVYLSYFGGSTPNQRGPWLSWLEDIFGVRHRLRYGLVEPIEDDVVDFNFVEPFGDIPEGATLSFRVAGEHSARGYLPVDPAGARVLAVDARGRPALLSHALGSGSTILCTYPLEHMAARTPGVNPESTWQIYSALAVEAEVERPVHVADPRVLVGTLRGATSKTALFINCSSATVEAEPILQEGVTLQLATGPLSLEPFGIAAVAYEDPSATPVARNGRQPVAVGSTEGRDAGSELEHVI